MSIVRAQSNHWENINRICCLTGNNGTPIPENKTWIFGALWVGPYQYFLPHWTYVCVDSNKKVLGYLTGSPETKKFKRTIRWFYTVLLLGITIKELFFHSSKLHTLHFQGLKKFYKRELKLEKGPEDFFSKDTWNRIHSEFPAHLHTNLLPETRGMGLGKKLIIAFEDDLKKKGVLGIHLFCGQDPVGFYQKCGFSILEKIKFSPDGVAGIDVYCMVKSLN